MAKLIFCGEKFNGRVYEISAQRTTVGRGDTNTLSIHDPSVSEYHCEVYDNGEDLIIHDLGSRNGTVVNGKLLRNSQAPLAHGEIVKFGAVEARLEISHRASTSDTVTDVTAVHYHASHAAPPPPRPNPAATLDAGPTRDSSDHTLVIARPSTPAPATTPAPAPSPAPRGNRTWVLILAGLGIAVLLWWLLR